MPARLSNVDAISRDFAVPAPEDTTFSDPDEIFDLRNPISLNAAQVVGPNSRTDASGNLIPGRADTAAEIEAGTEAALSLGPEVMSFDPTIGSSGVPLSQLPTSIGGMSDSPVVGTAFPPIGARYDVTAGARLNEPEADLTTPTAPKMALPGGSARTSIEDDGLANAMAAAQGIDYGTRQNISDSFNNRSIRESEIGGRDDLARNQMLGGLLEINTPEGAERMRAAARRAEILGMPADQQAAVTAFPLTNDPAMDAPAGDTNPFIGITDVEAAANDAVIPQNTKNLSIFDISELENLEEDYYRTGAGSSDYDPMAAQATAEALRRAEDDVSALDRIAEARMLGEDIQNPPKTLRQATGRAPMTSGEAATNVSGIDSAGNVVSLAGASGYDTPEAAANRANALAQTATTADPDGSGRIVPAKDYAESDYKSPGVLDDYVDPYEDQFVKDSYEQQLFGDPPKTVQAFGGLVKLLSGGLIDINKLTAEHRRKGLKAYLETNELAYENGVVVGVKDPEGRTIYLGPQSPKEEDNTGGDSDGCPPVFVGLTVFAHLYSALRVILLRLFLIRLTRLRCLARYVLSFVMLLKMMMRKRKHLTLVV